MPPKLTSDAVTVIESSHTRMYSLQQVAQPRRKWRCAIPLLAIGSLAPGLLSWTKVNSMAITMRLQLSLPFNNQPLLSSLEITGKLQEGCPKAEQRLSIDANCCNGR